jgi:hypothetical protein
MTGEPRRTETIDGIPSEESEAFGDDNFAATRGIGTGP